MDTLSSWQAACQTDQQRYKQALEATVRYHVSCHSYTWSRVTCSQLWTGSLACNLTARQSSAFVQESPGSNSQVSCHSCTCCRQLWTRSPAGNLPARQMNSCISKTWRQQSGKLSKLYLAGPGSPIDSCGHTHQLTSSLSAT